MTNNERENNIPSGKTEAVISGYLVEIPAAKDYFALKSFLCDAFGAKRVWLRQYKPHTSDKDLFGLFKIKYAFVSEDLTEITVAGNDEFDPLGRLRGKVALRTRGIVPFDSMMGYLKLFHRLKSGGGYGGAWYFCRFEREEDRDEILHLLDLCGFAQEVETSTLNRNVLSLNVLEKQAKIGTGHFLDYSGLKPPRGQEVTFLELKKRLIRAYALSEEYLIAHEEPPKLKVKPAYIVQIPFERTKIVKSLLEEKGFRVVFVQLLSVSHREFYIDFHFRTADIGARGFGIEHTLSEEELLSRLGEM